MEEEVELEVDKSLMCETDETHRRRRFQSELAGRAKSTKPKSSKPKVRIGTSNKLDRSIGQIGPGKSAGGNFPKDFGEKPLSSHPRPKRKKNLTHTKPVMPIPKRLTYKGYFASYETFKARKSAKGEILEDER
jgi:hypothetical protein